MPCSDAMYCAIYAPVALYCLTPYPNSRLVSRKCPLTISHISILSRQQNATHIGLLAHHRKFVIYVLYILHGCRRAIAGVGTPWGHGEEGVGSVGWGLSWGCQSPWGLGVAVGSLSDFIADNMLKICRLVIHVVSNYIQFMRIPAFLRKGSFVQITSCRGDRTVDRGKLGFVYISISFVSTGPFFQSPRPPNMVSLCMQLLLLFATYVTFVIYIIYIIYILYINRYVYT